MADVLHRHLGFYISDAASEEMGRVVEGIVDTRLEPLVAVLDEWQAEVEETQGAEVVIGLEDALRRLRTALADRGAQDSANIPVESHGASDAGQVGGIADQGAGDGPAGWARVCHCRTEPVRDCPIHDADRGAGGEVEEVVTRLPLAAVLAGWRDGDTLGWRNEFRWLRNHDGPSIDRLASSVQHDGIREPILLGNDGRVWDGHHRLCVADMLALPDVPVRLAAAPAAVVERAEGYGTETNAPSHAADSLPYLDQTERRADHDGEMNESSIHEGAEGAALTEAERERACEVMHDAYEAAAQAEGWETQERSRKPWADVPEANKATMRAAVAALLDHLAGRLARQEAIDTRSAVAVAAELGISRSRLYKILDVGHG